MMVGSGTTSHMTAQSDCVFNQRMCNMSIFLADDATTIAHRTGFRNVTWKGEKKKINIRLSDTLVARDIRNILLSVPALVKMDIGAFFLSRKAVFLHLLQKNKFIGRARQASDGLFYISDNETSTFVDSIDKNVQAMFTAVQGHFE